LGYLWVPGPAHAQPAPLVSGRTASVCVSVGSGSLPRVGPNH